MEQGTSGIFVRAENQFEGSKSYFSVILCSDNHSCHTQTYKTHTHTHTHTHTNKNSKTYTMTPSASQNQSLMTIIS